jgi:hypothetical protein
MTVVSCICVQKGDTDDLYLPYVIVAVSIAEDKQLMQLIDKLLVPTLLPNNAINKYLHYIVIANELEKKALLLNTCVDLVYDPEELDKRITRISRTVNKEGQLYMYCRDKTMSHRAMLNQHVYMRFVYIWSLLLRQDKERTDCCVYGLEDTSVLTVAKQLLLPSFINRDKLRRQLLVADRNKQLKQCPLWMSPYE